jgi:hypothetical protein
VIATRLDRRTLGGIASALVGAIVLAATLLVAGPGSARTVHATIVVPVWLAISLNDSTGHQFNANSNITITASVTNPATFSNSSSATSADAHPTVTFSSYGGEFSNVSGGGNGWSCTDNTGTATCSNSVLSPGSTATFTYVFTVTGVPGDSANVYATVNGAGNESNQNSSSTAVDMGTVANPGSYTNEAPSNCFPRKVGNDMNVSGSAQTLTFTDSGVNISVILPAGAVSGGALLSLYAGDPTCWNAYLASKTQTFVDGYAVAWSGSVNNTASSSLTLGVTDTKISSGNPVYRSNISGLVSSQYGTAGSGKWSASFTDDPGFIAAQPITASSSAASSSAASTSTSTPRALARAGAAPGRRPAPLVPIVIGVLLIVAGTTAIGLRRRTA